MTRTSYGRTFTGALVAASIALGGPATVRASEPVAEASADSGVRDELTPQAAEHVAAARRHFESGSYLLAEESFRRASFFSPKWRPLHYNLAVLAEAQGHLGPAVREYRAFRPYATPDEAMIVDQRIHELDDRRRRIVAQHRRQIGGAAGLLTVSVGMIGTAVTLWALAVQLDKSDETVKDRRSGMLVGGGFLGGFGALFAVGAGISLAQGLKWRRQLEGIALGRTRLQWAGGAGARLRF
jgi:hypothetical protein